MSDYQPNQLLTVATVCAEYGISRTTVYELLANGQLKAVVLGKRGTRIRRGDIDAFIKSLPPYRPLNKRLPQLGDDHEKAEAP